MLGNSVTFFGVFLLCFQNFCCCCWSSGLGGGVRRTEEADAHIPIHVVSLMFYSQKNYYSLFFECGFEPLCCLKLLGEAEDSLICLLGSSYLDVGSTPGNADLVVSVGHVKRANIISVLCITKS